MAYAVSGSLKQVHKKYSMVLNSYKPTERLAASNKRSDQYVPILIYANEMSHITLQEVSFGTTTIQKLRRITLDQNLLRTLNLEEGDSVEVVLIVATGEICLRKCKNQQADISKKNT